VIQLAEKVAPVTGKAIKHKRAVAKKRERFNAIFRDLMRAWSALP